MRGFIEGVSEFIRSSALVWVIGILIFLLYAIPTQSLEYYRNAAIELSFTGRSPAAVAIFSGALLLSVVIHLFAIVLWVSSPIAIGNQSSNSRSAGRATAQVLVSILPMLGLLIGIISAYGASGYEAHIQHGKIVSDTFSRTVFDVVGHPSSSVGYDVNANGRISNRMLLMAVLCVVFIFILSAQYFWLPVRNMYVGLARAIDRHSILVFSFGLSGLFLCTFFSLRHLQEIALTARTFGLLGIGLALYVIILGAAASFSRRHRLPLCFLILVWPFGLALFWTPETHRILEWKGELSEGPEGLAPTQTTNLDEKVKAIVASFPQGVDRAVPLYVVAAPGGGMYASYLSSMILTLASEEIPSFRRNLVAISSVSGGSLGAALYSSLYQSNSECAGYVSVDQELKERAAGPIVSRLAYLRSFHAHDFLAPLTGALLFVDAVQAYVPFTLSGFDRAHALEGTLLHAWKEAIEDIGGSLRVSMKRAILPSNLTGGQHKPLSCPLSRTMSNLKDGPILLFNVTEVASGRQRVISPINVDGGYGPDQTADLSLVRAAVLSARFPYVTPAGWFESIRNKVREKVFLVDGGYYENSGVATAQAIVRRLKELRSASRVNVAVRLIVLAGPEGERASNDQQLSEFLSPIRALSRTRSARGENYIAEVRRSMPSCQSKADGMSDSSDCQIIVGIKSLLYPLPLGWDMSELSRLVIEAQAGAADTCHADIASGVANGACLLDFLRSDLRP